MTLIIVEMVGNRNGYRGATPCQIKKTLDCQNLKLIKLFIFFKPLDRLVLISTVCVFNKFKFTGNDGARKRLDS